VEREIKLDGGEISILKAIGLSGSQLAGKVLLDRLGDLEQRELIDTMSGLMDQGFILSSKVNIYSIEDLERSAFRVNPSYSRDLKDALRPGGRRREERTRARRTR
jgi:hypothetical protein